MEKAQTLADFYQTHLALMPGSIQSEIGHFNVFRWADLGEGKTKCSSFGRKQFYKISLLSGCNTYHYADKSVRIEQNALIFSNPQVPYHWELHDEEQRGMFCLFTEAFLPRLASLALPEYPVFQPGGQAVFQLTDAQYEAMEAVFARMETELAADYVFKYDVLRNAVLDLIHAALRLQPAAALHQHPNAAARPTWAPPPSSTGTSTPTPRPALPRSLRSCWSASSPSSRRGSGCGCAFRWSLPTSWPSTSTTSTRPSRKRRAAPPPPYWPPASPRKPKCC